MKYLLCLFAVLVFATSAFAGYSSSSSSSSSRSSYSSGVRSYSPPSRPFTAPITKVTPVTTPSSARPVRIVPVVAKPQPQTVINKTVINKTVYQPAPAPSYQPDHFWSNWMLFSMFERHNQPQTVIVQGGTPVATNGAPLMAPVPAAPAHEWIWPTLIFILMVGGGIALWAWNKDRKGA